MQRRNKMKAKTSKTLIKAAALLSAAFLFAASPLSVGQSIYAADSNAPSISIEKPSGWQTGSTKLSIMVDTSQTDVAKIEAKIGKHGTWKDVTKSKSVTIDSNDTVYVRVTDTDGNVYEQNRSIYCYDNTKPTVSATLTNGVLTIQGSDVNSDIVSYTVNGTKYSDLDNGTLKIQLTQKNFKTKTITITATDASGNTSDKYTLQNPYYEWAKTNSSTTGSSSSTTLSATSATSTTDSTSDTENTSPLPQDAGASEQTDAKGTVEERTVTGIEEEIAESGDETESVTQTASEGTKVFYTISTKSGKIFYLVIDNSKSEDNVYFLTEVSENDLLNFTLSDTVTLPEEDSITAEVEGSVDASYDTDSTETDAAEDDEVQMPEDKSGFGSKIFVIIILALVFAGAYYVKVYKPKHEDDDEEYEEEDEAEEESEYEEESEAEESEEAESKADDDKENAGKEN
jgi:hypothetical protein